MNQYQVLQHKQNKPIKMWTQGVPVEEEAKQQLINIAEMPFIFSHIALMPDVHLGKGSTIGSVIPTKNAIIPAAVGVDIGCGMMAVRTSLIAGDLSDHLYAIRSAIEQAVPHGRTVSHHTKQDKGSWQQYLPPFKQMIAQREQELKSTQPVDPVDEHYLKQIYSCTPIIQRKCKVLFLSVWRVLVLRMSPESYRDTASKIPLR